MAAPSTEDKQLGKLTGYLSTTGPADNAGPGTSMEDQGLRDFLRDFIQTEFGSDVKSLKKVSDLLEKHDKERRQLDAQVLTASSSVPLQVCVALRAAEDAKTSVDDLLQRERELSNTLQQHLQAAQPWVDSLGQTLGQVETLERHVRYLQCLQHIEELSDAVQQCVMTNSGWEAVSSLNTLCSLLGRLQTSGCSHLHSFLRETLAFWHKIIKDRLTTDFEEVLSLLHWPFLSPPIQSLAPPSNAQETSAQLELLVAQLVALQSSDDLLYDRPAGGHVGVASVPPVSLPIQVMLVPLSKRFRYHFTGARPTNTPSKPEWYLTQVLMWMGNNSAFMEDQIQPILDRAGANVNAKGELCRGLLALVQEKLAHDAPRLLHDDALFCHLVDEVLQFERELRGTHGYASSQPGALLFLLEDATLQKWLSLEKKMALEKVDSMLSAEGAWSSQYKDISDMDELKAPDCAETFMTLLLVITERYRALPCVRAQLRFLELQRELMDDLRIRLTQVMKEESRTPLSARYAAILNAVNYICTVLLDWADNVFFLQLQQAAVALGEEEARGLLGGLGPAELGRLASLEGSVFQELLALLDRLRADMLGRLLDTLMRDVRDAAQPYIHTRWLALPSQVTMVTMSLSSQACPLMRCLREQLLALQQSLCLPLFTSAWQGLAQRLDAFLYQDLILYNHFNEGGAAQLHFDMSRNLFPLFGHYCKRPDNLFKHVKEACTVMSLNTGSALLLRDLLKEAQEEQGGAGVSPESALNELGVFLLSPADVWILLNLRASWPGH